MVVGTAADYPPFAFYTPDFKLDGFDIALITDIARILGVNLELRDMAFEGLSGALQLNQIDLAIAAITVNPERQEVLDFSNVYFISDSGVLANSEASEIVVRTVDDLADKRLGVQQGSVFESWARTNLVDTGLTAASNLFVYKDATGLIKDLKDGWVELVLLDLLVAENYVREGGVRLVGQGLNRQQFAIAVPKNAYALLGEINRALEILQDQGRIAELANQYTGLEPDEVVAIPEPTPGPTSTPLEIPPTPAAGCIDGMRFESHLTFPDQNMTNPAHFLPGTNFTKGWRVQNSGTCPWDITYSLVYVGGNTSQSRMGGEPVQILGLVVPQVDYDIFVNLVAPITPGVYQGFWQMRNDRGEFFGDRISVGIIVDPVNGTVPPGIAPPQIQRFVTATNAIVEGQCVLLDWIVSGSTNQVSITRNGAEVWNGAPVQGSINDCPPGSGDMAYDLVAIGPGGSAQARQNVHVYESDEPVPTNQAPGAPVINSFNVTPTTVYVSQCVAISWNVGGVTDLVQIKRNGATILENAPLVGEGQDCLSSPGLVTYRMEASNRLGEIVIQELQVTVVQ
jgi:polar amino acid transport system substrate-binding protein